MLNIISITGNFYCWTIVRCVHLLLCEKYNCLFKLCQKSVFSLIACHCGTEPLAMYCILLCAVGEILCSISLPVSYLEKKHFVH